jgi:transposase
MFAEEGFVFPVGLPLLRQGIVALINDTDARITPLLRRLGSMYLEQLAALQQWVDELAAEIAEIFKRNEGCRRLATVSALCVQRMDAPQLSGRAVRTLCR